MYYTSSNKVVVWPTTLFHFIVLLSSMLCLGGTQRVRCVCRPVQLLPKALWNISRRDHSGGHATSNDMGTYAYTRWCIIIVGMLRGVSLSPALLVISLLLLGLTEAHWCPWPMRNFIHYVTQQSCKVNIYKLQRTDNFYYGIFYMVLFLL